jgi:hypothetical protein
MTWIWIWLGFSLKKWLIDWLEYDYDLTINWIWFDYFPIKVKYRNFRETNRKKKKDSIFLHYGKGEEEIAVEKNDPDIINDYIILLMTIIMFCKLVFLKPNETLF